MRPVAFLLLLASSSVALLGIASVSDAEARGRGGGVSGGGGVRANGRGGTLGYAGRLSSRSFGRQASAGFGFRRFGGTRLGFGPGYGADTGIGFGPGYGPASRQGGIPNGGGFGGGFGYGGGGSYGGSYGYGYGSGGSGRGVASAYGIAAPPVQPPAVFVIGEPRPSGVRTRSGRRNAGSAGVSVDSARAGGESGVVGSGPQIIRLSGSSRR